MTPPSVVIVDADGFASASGKLAGVALGLQPLTTEIQGLVARAESLDLGAVPATIERSLAPVGNVRITLETLSIAFRERARWARLAAADPEVRRWLNHLLEGRNGMVFLLSSALGGRDAISRLSLPGGDRTLSITEVAALVGLARLRGSQRFANASKLVEAQVSYAALNSLDELPKGWGTQQLVSRLDGKASLSLESIARLVEQLNQRQVLAGAYDGIDQARELVSLFKALRGTGNASRAGGPGPAALLAGLLKYWQDGPNPLLTEKERRQRAAATAATNFAVGGAAGATAIVICGVAGIATAGAGLVACGIGGALIGGIAGAKYFGPKIDDSYHGSKTENQFREDLRHDRQQRYESHLGDFLRDKKNVEYRMAEQTKWMQAGDWSPERQRDFDEHINEISRKAFYRKYGHPARDAIDEKLIEESDRTAWHRAQLEFNLQE